MNIIKNLNVELLFNSATPLMCTYPKGRKMLVCRKDAAVLRYLLYNSQKPRTTSTVPVSDDCLRPIQPTHVVEGYLNINIPSVIHENTLQPGDGCVQRNKLNTERQELQVLMHFWNLKF